MRHGLDTLWLWLWLHNILIDHYCNIDNHNIGIVKNCLYLNNVTDIILSIKLWCRHITAVESSPESLTIFNTHTFTVSRGVFKHCNSYPHCNIPNIYHSPSNDLASVSGFSNTTLVGTKLSMLLFFSHACTYICILFSAKAFTWHPFILSPTTFYNFDHLLLFFWSRSIMSALPFHLTLTQPYFDLCLRLSHLRLSPNLSSIPRGSRAQRLQTFLLHQRFLPQSGSITLPCDVRGQSSFWSLEECACKRGKRVVCSELNSLLCAF